MIRIVVDYGECSGTTFDFDSKEDEDFKSLLNICLKQKKDIEIFTIEE